MCVRLAVGGGGVGGRGRVMEVGFFFYLLREPFFNFSTTRAACRGVIIL